MESNSFNFLNINLVALGIIAAAIFVVVAIQIKNRKTSKYLHIIKEKLFGRKKK
jgi:flagellar biogenesis protein FliO